MLKKILYGIACLMLGFMIFSSVMQSRFYKVFTKTTAEKVSKGDYLTVERYFSFSIDKEENFLYKGQLENGPYVEIYNAINTNINSIYDDKGKDTDSDYYTVEESIQIALFNIPKEFALKDNKTNSTTGGVKLIFDEEQTLFFPFKSLEFNSYDYVDYFSFLPLTIYKKDFDIKIAEYNLLETIYGIDQDSYVNKIQIIDGDNDTTYSISKGELTHSFDFEHDFFTNYRLLLNQYNAYQEKIAKEEYEENETKDSIQKLMSDLAKDVHKVSEDHGYNKTIGTSWVTKSSRYRVPIILFVVGYLSLVIVLGYFIFRRRKSSVRPSQFIRPQQNKTFVNPQRQPQQFSRKDLEANDNVIDVVEEVQPKPTTEVEVENNQE